MGGLEGNRGRTSFFGQKQQCPQFSAMGSSHLLAGFRVGQPDMHIQTRTCTQFHKCHPSWRQGIKRSREVEGEKGEGGLTVTLSHRKRLVFPIPASDRKGQKSLKAAKAKQLKPAPGTPPSTPLRTLPGWLLQPGATLAVRTPRDPTSPRDRPARTWGLTARGGAERAVPGQQAGQQRAEPSHVAARGDGDGQTPESPDCRIADKPAASASCRPDPGYPTARRPHCWLQLQPLWPPALSRAARPDSARPARGARGGYTGRAGREARAGGAGAGGGGGPGEPRRAARIGSATRSPRGGSWRTERSSLQTPELSGATACTASHSRSAPLCGLRDCSRAIALGGGGGGHRTLRVRMKSPHPRMPC